MTDETRELLFAFLDNDVTINDFEKWIHNNKELEIEQPTLYHDLILFNFRDKDARQIIKDKLRSYIDDDQFNVWKTKNLLNKIIGDEIDIVLATRKLRELYFETNKKFLPPRLGLGFDSELDDLPTQPLLVFFTNKRTVLASNK